MTGANDFNLIDILVVIAYLAVVVLVGKFSSGASKSEEGFFLAGRKLGKLFQFFLNFGNAADSNSAVSTSSAVYQEGASGAWLTLAAIFLNPYYWFMGPWFRRARLVTTADLFEDRFGGTGLGRLYALFQIGVAVLYIGFANVVSYKIAASLLPAPPNAPLFYIVFTAVVALYIIMGGLTATAINDALQSILIIFFSAILVPFGLKAVGGWKGLAANAPAGAFELFGRSAEARFTGWSVAAILFVTLIQANANMSLMTLYGSAKGEFAARFGNALGSYGKRVMTMLWILVGLIAMSLYGKASGRADPDLIWGTMSRRLLGHGCLGLMAAGLLAGNMSLLGTQSVAISALFARNIAGQWRWARTEAERVRLGRFAIAGVLALGVVVASLMDNVVSIILLLLCVNLAFGAAILLVFQWRRLTVRAVWACVILSTGVTIVVPFGAQVLTAVRTNPGLVLTAAPKGAEQPLPIFFEKVARADANDPRSPLAGHGRFNLEAWLLGRTGVRVTGFTPGQLLTTQYVFDGVFPFLILFLVSWLTPPTDPARLDRFYGKMKTPADGADELDALAMEETRKNPHRFDDQKLFPKSSWEFTRWTRTDFLGFVACCAASVGIVIFLRLFLQGIG